MRNDQERVETPAEVPESGEELEARENKESGWAEVGVSVRKALRNTSATARAGWKARASSLTTERSWPIAALVVGVLALAVVSYVVLSRSTRTGVRSPSPSVATPQSPQIPAPQGSGESFLPEVFGPQPSSQQEQERWPAAIARITLKFALAGLLTALLAFRPRRDSPILQRNPFVAQTQILLAVVAAALMMVVSDNAARAFGIFAAASLVRFRTNIRDPKEITVLLISLAIGLACGVGKMELAVILSVFVFIMLSVLEYYEPEQVFRSLELTVATRKSEETDEVLREIFEKRNITSELRKMDREDPDNPVAKIVYYVNVSGDLSTDKLSEEIFAADQDNLDSIQWDQKKTSSYVYR